MCDRRKCLVQAGFEVEADTAHLLDVMSIIPTLLNLR